MFGYPVCKEEYANNLKKMMEDKSIEEYLRFLQRQFPGKF